MAIGTFGGSIVVSAVNAYAAGYHGIYSNDAQGSSAYFLDHTVGQGTTAIGTVNMAIQAIGGARFNKKLSKGSNAFILTGGSIKSNSIGNAISIRKGDAGKLEILRAELLHSWQYRRGGLLNLTKLIVEQINKNGNYPYETPGTLENQAHSAAKDGAPIPWELRCRTCDKFY